MGAFDTIVAATVQVDTAQANANVKDLNKSLKDTKQALADTGKEATTTGKSVQETAGSFGKLKDQMGALPGPIGGASEGVGKLNTAFKTLLANPVTLVITAIVAALGFLYKAFTNSFEGGEKMEQVFAGIKAAGTEVLTIILDLGKAVYKFFTGDWKGAADDAKAAIDGIVHGVTGAYNAMSNLTKQAQQLARDQADNDLDQAKRQAKLAELRAQAYDDTIPIAKRKAALLELKKDSEQNAKDDLALAKKVADNKIAMLTVEKDGYKKNYVEIQKIRADQVRGETENANELRNIGRQITSADKAELAERRANAQKAADEAKKAREQNQAFQEQLAKLQHANALAGIVDQYTKEKQALENKIEDDAAAIKKQYANKQITRAQYEKLNQEAEEGAHLQREALTKKHQDDVQANEQKFQEQLADIRSKTAIAGLVTQEQKEQAQLELAHAKELADAEKDYADDAAKMFQVKAAIDAEYAALQAAMDERNKKAADKKKLDAAKKKTKDTIDDPNSSVKEQKAALDEEQKDLDASFANKTISEQDYNKGVQDLADERKAIREKELAHIAQVSDATTTILDGVSEAIGKNTAAGKALAIASATIKALQTEITIIANLSDVGPFGFAMGIAAAAATAIQLFNTIKQIEQVPVPGQSAGASVAAPALPTAPVAPAQQSTRLNSASINAVGSAVTQSNAAQAPVRAFVLDADVQNNADRDARLTRAARLGG